MHDFCVNVIPAPPKYFEVKTTPPFPIHLWKKYLPPEGPWFDSWYKTEVWIACIVNFEKVSEAKYYRALFEDTLCTCQIEFVISNNNIAHML